MSKRKRPPERPHRTSGLGKPISEDPHYIVRVFYGGDWFEESLEGPFATEAEANALTRNERAAGRGAIVYRCENTHYAPAEEPGLVGYEYGSALAGEDSPLTTSDDPGDWPEGHFEGGVFVW